ncbi:MFS general substrate transporter [Rhizodiscina lignyota]|uniref:MFS general substrate transporter n=1 Tax=Rhizodiscina lignyota TaxID=1504668 RepID=A0A9P4M978_9PEZI|nr:MFS general substrate transporter [Rhizodiscina lignyota]
MRHASGTDLALQSFEHNQTAEVDGGRRAWLQVFGSFMIFVNIWGFTFIFGIFQSFYQLSYLPSESESSISWIGTIQSALLSIVGVLAGPLYDLGAFRFMLLSGAFLVLLGLFTLSLSSQYYQIFLSQGVCIGIGGGLLYIPSLALISGSFKRRRAIASGIVTCGIGIGGVIYTAAFQSLLPRVGFAWTVRVLAFMALVVFGLSIPALLISTSGQKRSQTTRKIFDVNALKDGPFLVYSLASFFIFLGYLVPFFFMPSFAQIVLGTSRSLSFWALAVSSATSIFGRLGAALAAQKMGSMMPWIACGALSGVLCLCWIRISSVAAFFAFCGLYGFFSGALVALPPTVFPRICKAPNLLGTWMGMSWLCSGIAFLVGSPIAGALIRLWSGLLLLLGTGTLVALWVLMVRTRREPIWI